LIFLNSETKNENPVSFISSQIIPQPQYTFSFHLKKTMLSSFIQDTLARVNHVVNDDDPNYVTVSQKSSSRTYKLSSSSSSSDRQQNNNNNNKSNWLVGEEKVLERNQRSQQESVSLSRVLNGQEAKFTRRRNMATGEELPPEHSGNISEGFEQAWLQQAQTHLKPLPGLPQPQQLQQYQQQQQQQQQHRNNENRNIRDRNTTTSTGRQNTNTTSNRRRSQTRRLLMN